MKFDRRLPPVRQQRVNRLTIIILQRFFDATISALDNNYVVCYN